MEKPTHRRNFTELYQATVTPLRRYLAQLLSDPHEAQDVAHDAYLRILPKAEDPAIEKPEALLFVTAKRLAINRLKRRRLAPFNAEPVDLNATASSAPNAAQQVMAKQELADLETAIAELPAGCRSVLLLRKVEQLSHREIADRLGLAISTVEKQHARALRLLRAALNPAAPLRVNPPSNPDAN